MNMFWFKEKPLEGTMIAIGEAKSVRSITHPFIIRKGMRRLDLRVEEAEDLRDWLTKQLERNDVRRPMTVTIRCPEAVYR
tara:strand:- start:117 stop:356 length:240 start_codon:yes stop_codon:yes gene_type:complete